MVSEVISIAKKRKYQQTTTEMVALFLCQGERILFLEHKKRLSGIELDIPPGFEKQSIVDKYLSKAKTNPSDEATFRWKADLAIVKPDGTKQRLYVCFVRGVHINLGHKHCWPKREHVGSKSLKGMFPGSEIWLHAIIGFPGTIVMGTILQGPPLDLQGLAYTNI